MTVEEIKARVGKIDRYKCDDESAHALEDELYLDFIKWVAAKGGVKASTKAKEVLKASEIKFSR